MNAAAYGDVTADGDIKVLFIGNSITLHGVAPQIGWTNRWGMAASSQEKDYVHLVAAGIARETGRKPQLIVKADFADEPGMRATGLFTHAGVANHPGDRGMAAIASAILKTLFP